MPKSNKTGMYLFPVLLPLYIPWYTLALNAHLNTVRPEIATHTGLVLGLVGLVWLLGRLVFKDWAKGAFAAGFLVTGLFSYGHLRDGYTFLTGGGSRALAGLIWLAVMALILLITVRIKPGTVRKLAWPLNILGLVLLLFQVPPLVQAEFMAPGVGLEDPAALTAGTDPEPLPDVYYLILDGFSPPAMVKAVFGRDNSDFTQKLRRMGFQVADRSLSNYMQTPLSLASSYNASYLSGVRDNRLVRQSLFNRIGASRVLKFFRSKGYTLINFESGYESVSGRPGMSDTYLARFGLSQLDLALMRRTPFHWVYHKLAGEAPFSQIHRRRVLFTFDRLRRIAPIPGPKLVMAHILSPHPPFVFNADGSAHQGREHYFSDGTEFGRNLANNREYYYQRYPAQHRAIGNLLLPVLAEILGQSKTRPIIILQADHGSGYHWEVNSLEKTCLPERFAILNALLLPPGSEPIPDDLTPVNNFRVVLNSAFGTDLKLLPNRHYFSTWTNPGQLVEVTDRLQDIDLSGYSGNFCE